MSATTSAAMVNPTAVDNPLRYPNEGMLRVQTKPPAPLLGHCSHDGLQPSAHVTDALARA